MTTTAEVINSALDALLKKQISPAEYLIIIDKAEDLERSQAERGLISA